MVGNMGFEYGFRDRLGVLITGVWAWDTADLGYRNIVWLQVWVWDPVWEWCGFARTNRLEWGSPHLCQLLAILSVLLTSLI